VQLARKPTGKATGAFLPSAVMAPLTKSQRRFCGRTAVQRVALGSCRWVPAIPSAHLQKTSRSFDAGASRRPHPTVDLLRLTHAAAKFIPSISERGLYGDVAALTNRLFNRWRSRLFARVSCALCSCAGDLGLRCDDDQEWTSGALFS